MTIDFGQGKLEEPERQAILEAVYQRAKGAAKAAVRAVVEAMLEAEVTAKLGREKGAVRHISGQPREVDWVCGQCGCADAQYFTRDGHDRRSLQTGWGSIQGLRVPMLECQQCGHDVICHFTILEKYERFWLDLDQDVVLGSGLGESLRHVRERWGEAVGSSIGLRTLNERINQIAPLLSQTHQGRITQVPAVIQFDGIWLRLQVPTGTLKTDRCGRGRQQNKGKRMVLLVALRLWADGSGRREILDWELAEGETQPDWQRLLDRLWERGVRPETGLQAIIRDGKGELGATVAQVYGTRVIEQRCVFHKLRNVADKAREDLSGEAHRELREQLLEQASAIYQAEAPAQARERLHAFASTWREQAPKAVATLQRNFEQTIAFYALRGIARELVRTTSLLERTNRELRRKFRIALSPEPSGDDEEVTLVQRGLDVLLRHVEHTVGVYSFFASLCRTARQERAMGREHRLLWWETGLVCERRYRHHDRWHNLRPDAMGEYQAAEQRVRFWLEWDRATMGTRDLVAKFSTYAHYATSREWYKEPGGLPLLLVVAPAKAQEMRIARIASALLKDTPALAIATTTATRLVEQGPIAAIWYRVPTTYQQTDIVPRSRLYGASSHW